MKSFYFLLPLFAVPCLTLLSRNNFFSKVTVAEICDNALDDDGDGLADLNDPDCDCPLAQPFSLIPNPSFEEMDCCPQNRSQLSCATGWVQASEATTDYLHTCGWMGWENLPPPLPFPDGEGCVGFRDGRIGSPQDEMPEPNWKEYAGACLLGPLKAGTSYRFQFYVGFSLPFNSPPTTIDFFGATDCANLPFGTGDEGFGCPTNGPGWVWLGATPISGHKEWKLAEINVTPSADIHAIAIGPNCTPHQSFVPLYYFFDNLVLAEVKEFEMVISASAHPCAGDIDLKVPYYDTLQYQWYLNGIALPGATQPVLSNIQQTGNYQVRVLGPYSCRITQVFSHQVPYFFTPLKHSVCQGETFDFLGSRLTENGIYTDTLQSWQGCDSIVQLSLSIIGVSRDTVAVKIFEEESWKIGKKSYSQAGEYDARLDSWLGCDSLVHLILEKYRVYVPNVFSPNGDGFNDVFTVFAGDDVKQVVRLEVFDRWGNLVFTQQDLAPNSMQQGWNGETRGKPASQGVYVYMARLLLTDGKVRVKTGEVTLLK